METLSHIIASFDIFQVIINVFPNIFQPLAGAFQSIYLVMLHFVKNMVMEHPGLVSGVVIFLLTYGVYSGIRQFRKAIIFAPQASPQHSL